MKIKPYLQTPAAFEAAKQLVSAVLENETRKPTDSEVSLVLKHLRPLIAGVVEKPEQDIREKTFGARIVLIRDEDFVAFGDWRFDLSGMKAVWEYVAEEAKSVAEFMHLDAVPEELTVDALKEKTNHAHVYMSRNLDRMAAIRVFLEDGYVVRIDIGHRENAEVYARFDAEALDMSDPTAPKRERTLVAPMVRGATDIPEDDE